MLVRICGCADGFAGILYGVLADYMLRRTTPRREPEPLSFSEAAALSLVTITAWGTLLDKGDVHTLQRAFVHSASGGMGHVGV